MREVCARVTLSPMIFVIVMEVLNALICLAEKCDILKPLGHSAMKCQASGADDLVVLVAPLQWDFFGLDFRSIPGTFDEGVTTDQASDQPGQVPGDTHPVLHGRTCLRSGDFRLSDCSFPLSLLRCSSLDLQA